MFLKKNVLKNKLYYSFFCILFLTLIHCAPEKDMDGEESIDLTDEELVDALETVVSASSEEDTELNLTVSFPEHTRTIYVDDETNPRTITFTQDGDFAECSVEGEDVEDCSDGSYTWDASNLNTAHTIIASDEEDNEETYTFTPSEQYADTEFVTCSEEVSENLSFDEFEDLTSNDEEGTKVICLSDGISVATDEGEERIEIQDDSIMIIAREGESVTFENTQEIEHDTDDDGAADDDDSDGTADYKENEASNGVFYHGSKTGVLFVGITIQSSGSDGHGIYSSGGRDYSGSVLHSTIQTRGESAYGLKLWTPHSVNGVTVQTSGVAGRGFDIRYGNPTTITDTSVTTENESSVAYFIMNNYEVEMEDITIDAQQSSCIAHSSYGAGGEERAVTIDNAQINCGSTAIAVKHSGDGTSTFELSNSTIKTVGVGLYLQGVTQVTINNNQFIKEDSSDSWDSAALKLYTVTTSTGADPTATATDAFLYSTENNNTICNEVSSEDGKVFNEILNTEEDVTENDSENAFSAENQRNHEDNDDIELCSEYGIETDF